MQPTLHDHVDQLRECCVHLTAPGLIAHLDTVCKVRFLDPIFWIGDLAIDSSRAQIDVIEHPDSSITIRVTPKHESI
jgi:hypothetical protein